MPIPMYLPSVWGRAAPVRVDQVRHYTLWLAADAAAILYLYAQYRGDGASA
jgi:hypothetical protein